jgi:alanine-synthesizing transaminase
MCLHRYSQRLLWPPSNIFSRLVEHKRQSGAPLLDLTISNPTEALADYPHQGIASAYGAIEDFTYRPDPAGDLAARSAVAEYYRARGIDISPERLLLTASTSEAYALLFKLFCDPGDEVLAPLPSYPLFEYLAAFESVRITPYRLRYDGSWFLDLASLRESISSRTRALIVVNPNNPTGSFLKQDEAEELARVASEHGLPIISDEVFMDYAIAPSAASLRTLIGAGPNLTFSLNGLSKAAGMPQMKLAWIAISGPEAECTAARQRLELLADTYLSVATPVQCALPRLLQIGASIQQQIADRLGENLIAMHTLLANSPAHPLPVEGGWSAIIRLPRTNAEETWIACLLEERDVIVQPGYFFDMETEAYIVVSLLTAPEVFAESIRRIEAAIAKRAC